MSEHLIYTLISRIEHGFGRLEEGQRQNRMSFEQGTKALHQRIDRVEDKIERHQASAPSPSSTDLFKIAGLVLSHWRTIAWMLSLLLGLYGIKNPEVLKMALGKP